jgi:hypothetical protein
LSRVAASRTVNPLVMMARARFEFFAGDDGLTAAFSTARCGRGKTSASALLDQVPIELTQRTEQVED